MSTAANHAKRSHRSHTHLIAAMGRAQQKAYIRDASRSVNHPGLFGLLMSKLRSREAKLKGETA
jgi:hypothetical protein